MPKYSKCSEAIRTLAFTGWEKSSEEFDGRWRNTKDKLVHWGARWEPLTDEFWDTL